jgi:hypothetical protein
MQQSSSRSKKAAAKHTPGTVPHPHIAALLV